MQTNKMRVGIGFLVAIALGGCGSEGGSASGSGGAGGIGGGGGNGGAGGGVGGSGGGSGGAGGSPLVCVPNSPVSCYTGPANTAGVGLCLAGSAMCNDQGTALGPCMGEVLPAAENCATMADENCNGAGPDCGVSVWSKNFGDFDGQYGRSIAADAMGNVFVCGVFHSKLDLGGGPITSNALDGFLTKLDPSGNHLWTKHYTGDSSQYPTSLAVDTAGNVVVVGSFAGTTDFGGGALVATDSDVFVAKYNAAGTHLWSKRYGEADVQAASAVAIDATGNITIGGTLLGAADFGGGLMTATDIDLFGIKLDPNGNHVWSKRFDQALGSQPELMGVAVDSAGNVAFTGYFFTSIDLGGGPLASAGNGDVFVVKLGPGGQHVWSKRFGNGLFQYAAGVGFDGGGNLFLAGGVTGSIDLGGGALVSAGSEDAFVAKLDAAGAHLWSKRYGDGQSQGFYDIAVSKTGDIALSLLLRGTVDFGGGPLTGAGVDIAIARLDSSGNHVWSRRAGDDSPQSANAIAFDEAGHVLLTGELVGSIDFGSGMLTSAGSSDLLIAKLAP